MKYLILVYFLTKSITAVHGQQWKKAEQLNPGDLLLQSNGKVIPVTNTIAEKRSAVVYNFSVQGLHNYYVSQGILVHNPDPDCDLPEATGVEAELAKKTGEYSKKVIEITKLEARLKRLEVEFNRAKKKVETAQKRYDLNKNSKNSRTLSSSKKKLIEIFNQFKTEHNRFIRTSSEKDRIIDQMNGLKKLYKESQTSQ